MNTVGLIKMSAKIQQPRHNEKKYEKLTKIVSTDLVL